MTVSSWPLPPHVHWRDFLANDELAALLEWVISGEARFTQATVKGRGNDAKDRIDPAVRTALTSTDLGPLRPTVEQRLLDALPQLVERMGTGGPPPRSLELELAAHGASAHFAPHFDIPIGEERRPLGAKAGQDRVLSAVLYFHREPKGFSGGNLRLYRFGASSAEAQQDPSNYLELEPLQNSLAVFPSWVAHEVRRVECPSGRFEDYRFALNCWFCRKL